MSRDNFKGRKIRDFMTSDNFYKAK